LYSLPVPACVVDAEGKVKYANELMKEVFTYKDIVDSNFFAITGVKRSAFFEKRQESGEGEGTQNGGKTEEKEKREILISRNDNYFALETNLNAKEDEDIIVYFFNVTQRESFKERYRNEQPCIIYISIDNYDEVVANTVEGSKKALPVEVDNCIMRWANQYDAVIESTGEDTYIMSVSRKEAEEIIESRFPVLDEVREIETRVDIPMSLSIGLGMGVDTIKETTELAEARSSWLVGRGGDQAVVKNADRTTYYGGKLMSYEKNNKGKSRVIAHALKQLILDSDKVLIMGHRWPDMDCFGAALAANRICEYLTATRTS